MKHCTPYFLSIILRIVTNDKVNDKVKKKMHTNCKLYELTFFDFILPKKLARTKLIKLFTGHSYSNTNQ